MSRTLELPDEVYEAVLRAADAGGTTVADLLRQRFATGNGERTEEEKQAARERLRRLAGIFNSGEPNFADSQRIDADLAREYADNHDS